MTDAQLFLLIASLSFMTWAHGSEYHGRIKWLSVFFCIAYIAASQAERGV